MSATLTASQYLTRLYEGEEIVVGPTTGKETLANSGDVFTGFLDRDFDRWGTNVPGTPTTVTPVAVYEQRKDGMFADLFGSLGDPRRLCLSQGQIRNFVREHRGKLHPRGWATFFLFQVGEELFVAYVRVLDGGLEADVHRFDNGHVWIAALRRRLVVPAN